MRRELGPQGFTCDSVRVSAACLWLARGAMLVPRANGSVGGLSFPKSPRQPDHSLPELPYLGGMEAHPRRSRIRSQHNQVSAARPAPRGCLHPVSCQARILQHWNQLLRTVMPTFIAARWAPTVNSVTPSRAGTSITQRVKEHDNRFPLVGGHAGLDCADCHKSEAVGQFQGLSIQCYSCHQRTFQQTTSPNHVAAGFSRSASNATPSTTGRARNSTT